MPGRPGICPSGRPGALSSRNPGTNWIPLPAGPQFSPHGRLMFSRLGGGSRVFFTFGRQGLARRGGGPGVVELLARERNTAPWALFRLRLELSHATGGLPFLMQGSRMHLSWPLGPKLSAAQRGLQFSCAGGPEQRFLSGDPDLKICFQRVVVAVARPGRSILQRNRSRQEQDEEKVDHDQEVLKNSDPKKQEKKRSIITAFKKRPAGREQEQTKERTDSVQSRDRRKLVFYLSIRNALSGEPLRFPFPHEDKESIVVRGNKNYKEGVPAVLGSCAGPSPGAEDDHTTPSALDDDSIAFDAERTTILALRKAIARRVTELRRTEVEDGSYGRQNSSNELLGREEEEDGGRGTTATPGVICSEFFAMAAVTMPRLDTGTGDYLNEMKEHFQMQCLLSLVFELIDNTEMKCIDYRQTFMQHSFLWKESLEETFADFLLDGAKDLVNPE
ncbi:unnamed protein product, partial [Amoebophrya sp. A120]|eukprot:GSA120T00014456001.1